MTEPTRMPDAEMPLEVATTPYVTADGYDVNTLHHALMRELEDPTDGNEPVPMWMLALFGALLFWGGYYFASNSADFLGYRYDVYNPPVLTDSPIAETFMPDTPEKLIVLGKVLYQTHCLKCHLDDGRGRPGKPPLAQSEWVVGAEASPERLARILLYGLNGPISVNGTEFDNAMPAWRDKLRDHEIAAVLSFIRQEWGNKAPVIEPETINAVRIAQGTRTNPVTVEELKKIAK